MWWRDGRPICTRGFLASFASSFLAEDHATGSERAGDFFARVPTVTSLESRHTHWGVPRHALPWGGETWRGGLRLWALFLLRHAQRQKILWYLEEMRLFAEMAHVTIWARFTPDLCVPGCMACFMSSLGRPGRECCAP